MSPQFSLFWGKMDVGFYVPKMKKTILTVKKSEKTSPCDGVGGATVPTAWVICIYVKVLEAYVGIFERHILLSR